MVWLKNPFMSYGDVDDLAALSEAEYDELDQFDTVLSSQVYNFAMRADEEGRVYIDRVLHQLWGVQIDTLGGGIYPGDIT